jgi:hypothetical protein
MTDQLVQKVKEMQRSDPIAKEQWYAYCEQYGDDVRDPAKHNVGFINGFITQYNSGQRLEFAGGQQLARFIKLGQKKSHAWKGVWEQYCGASDNPREHDPAKRDYAFLEGFFDFIGRKSAAAGAFGVMAGMGGMGGMGGMMAMPRMDMGPPAAKRMRPAAPPPMAMSGDLASQVKAYQRLGETEKNNWHTFCDTHLGGIRDPGRHDAATLQHFLSTYQGGSGGACSGAYAAPAMQHKPPGPPASGGATNPLAVKVKAYQRQGAAEKDNWHHFADSNCGGVRDPARLDTASLQNFIATYGL